MRVLLTGASAFTGLWFARKLAKGAHQVVAPLRGRRVAYEGTRRRRVEQLSTVAEIVEGVTFGDDAFLELARSGPWDVFAHHAANVADYKSPDFDVVAALADNTRGLRPVLETLAAGGLKAVVATGTVFEPDSGAGEQPMEAVSPYGLSKGLSWQVMRYRARQLGLPLGKFVIANPFGPYEEPRLGQHLMQTWGRGGLVTINTPAYLRDNIHVDLLALAYRAFVERMAETRADAVYGPMGYVETQGAFCQRFAAEMRDRTGLACALELKRQTNFPEPRARINTHVLDTAALGWSEPAAWDGVAAYYREALGL